MNRVARESFSVLFNLVCRKSVCEMNEKLPDDEVTPHVTEKSTRSQYIHVCSFFADITLRKHAHVITILIFPKLSKIENFQEKIFDITHAINPGYVVFIRYTPANPMFAI